MALQSKTFRITDADGERTIVTQGVLSFSRRIDGDVVGYRYTGTISGPRGGTTFLTMTAERLVLHYWWYPDGDGPAVEQISY